MSEEKHWTPEQQQCIYSHGGTLLVSAAAGSGKTAVLVQRIIERITDPEHPVDIDRLLVVTFTVAAAAEMKNRLAEKLAECVQQNPHDLRLQRQQLLLPNAAISTVDGFCVNLVRENFHQLDISPQFRIADEGQLALLKKEALTEALDECFAAHDPDFDELASMLEGKRGHDALAAAIEQVYEFIQPHPDPDRWLVDKSRIYADADTCAATVWGQQILAHAHAALVSAARLCDTALSLTDGDALLTERYRPALEDDAAFLDRALAVCRERRWDALCALLRAHTYTAFGRIQACSDPTAKARISALRDEMKRLINKQKDVFGTDDAACLSDLRDTRRLILALYTAVRVFAAKFTEKKSAGRWMDFSDLEHCALQLLTETDENGNRTPSPLARELSERYEEILVDEYQDTNVLQDALFSALSRDNGNLFFVGDVKQSIYGFRQAESTLFLNKRTAYAPFDGEHYPATVSLNHNFRSRRTVTDAVNFVFRQLMTEEFGGLRYDEREELKPRLPYPAENGHEPEFLVVDNAAAVLSDDEAEADAIARRIEEMVGTLTVGSDSRPLRYGDCCILLRSRRPVFAKVLEQHGIPVLTDTTDSFFNTAEIRLALSLLRCIDNPLLDVPLTAWLMSPLCGFTPDDMARLRRVRSKVPLYTALTAARALSDNPDLAAHCREAVAFLDRYRTLACQLTVDRLVTRLYEDTALPELMSARTDGDRRRRNLQLLQEHCTRFEQNGFRGLSAFVRYMDRLQEQNTDFTGAAKPDAGDAVRIMTVHGSKGLEFPVVFLAGLGHRFNRQGLYSNLLLHPQWGAGIKRRDNDTLNHYVTLPHQALALCINKTERAEDLRVLYVAMTRAREKLCLSMVQNNPLDRMNALAAVTDDTPTLSAFALCDASSYGAWLLSALLRHPSAAAWRKESDCATLSVIPDDNAWQLRILPAAAAITPPVITEEVAIPADRELAGVLRQRLAYRYPHEALSRIPAKLAASDTAGGTLNRKFTATVRPAFRSAAELTPTERGTALHTFMQFAEYRTAAQNLPREIERLTVGGWLTEAQASVLDRTALRRFFDSELYARMQRSACCRREFPFTALHPTAEGENTVVQGIADCVFEEDGALVIVDYKTDRVTDGSTLVERYREQLTVYKRALSEALALPVRECLLYSFALGCTVAVPTE